MGSPQCVLSGRNGTEHGRNGAVFHGLSMALFSAVSRTYALHTRSAHQDPDSIQAHALFPIAQYLGRNAVYAQAIRTDTVGLAEGA